VTHGTDWHDLPVTLLHPGGPVYDPASRPPDAANPKDVAGAKKPDVSVCPPAAILHMSKAMMLGAAKYGPYNWRDEPVKMRSYLAAAMRHIMAVIDGEDFDPEEGAGHHLAHAMATCAVVLDAMETGNLIDDRPKRGAAGPMVRHFNEHRTFERRTAESTVK
jgi:hypothetical protein